ncbi:MAG: CDP-alcohol phosphatidyltransferase family protein [Gammaproteobacteria bacterium]|nr:CDP-alcohol phosphatidyltransferase family protein [Gammaproteobacteria bacterium]
MKLSSIPNILTIMRLILVVPIGYLIIMEEYDTALVVFFVAAFSDAIDGVIARKYGWQSRLGSILDPLADKAMLVTAYVSLGWAGLLPVWIVSLVLVRDVLIVLGGVAYHYLIGRFSMEPSLISKANTFFQSLLALVVVFAQVYMPLEHYVVSPLVYIVAVTTIMSGFLYVKVWSSRAKKAQANDKASLHD